MAGMTFDQFMGHKARGEKKKYFNKWKQDDPYNAIVWLHPLASILALWRHGFPKIELVTNKDTQVATREVWTSRLLCWEDEDTIKARFHDRNTGMREKPVQICPVCLMTEHVYQLVRTNQMSWVDPLFKFEGSDPKKTRWIHAAGLWNGFSGDKLPDKAKAEMAAVPIERGGPLYQRDAWMQNASPKLEYAFQVVDNAAPENGLQISIEPALLGEKVQELVAKAIKSFGPDKGNPSKNPYAIQFEYDPRDGIEFSKKYDATPLWQVPMSPAVRRLLIETPALDMSDLAQRWNLDTVRANLERHALVKLPWDKFFAPAKAWERQKEAEQAQAPQQEQQRVPEVGHGVAPQLPQQPASVSGFACHHCKRGVVPDDTGICMHCSAEHILCGACEKPMLAAASVCPHCGAKYVVEGAVLPAIPPFRDEAPAAPAPTADANAYYAGDPTDDIPF